MTFRKYDPARINQDFIRSSPSEQIRQSLVDIDQAVEKDETLLRWSLVGLQAATIQGDDLYEQACWENHAWERQNHLTFWITLRQCLIEEIAHREDQPG